MTGAGLKKCIPTTRCGLDAAEAIAVTGSDEVLVARTQSPPTMAERDSNSSCLTASDSGAASITRSQGART
jgi:hypothetical protein